MRKKSAERVKSDAITKFVAKAEAAEKLAERVLLAAREFHNSLIALWEVENHTAIRALHAALKDHWKIAFKDGDEITEWSGGGLQQADSVAAVLERFELLFQDFIEKE